MKATSVVLEIAHNAHIEVVGRGLCLYEEVWVAVRTVTLEVGRSLIRDWLATGKLLSEHKSPVIPASPLIQTSCSSLAKLSTFQGFPKLLRIVMMTTYRKHLCHTNRKHKSNFAPNGMKTVRSLPSQTFDSLFQRFLYYRHS